MKSIKDIKDKVNFIKLVTPASIVLLFISNLYLFNKVNKVDYLQKEFHKHTRSGNHRTKNNIKEILKSCRTEQHSHYVDFMGEIYPSQPEIDCDKK